MSFITSVTIEAKETAATVHTAMTVNTAVTVKTPFTVVTAMTVEREVTATATVTAVRVGQYCMLNLVLSNSCVFGLLHRSSKTLHVHVVYKCECTYLLCSKGTM